MIIRYLYSIGLLMCCMGLPAQAKGIVQTSTQTKSTASAKSTAKTTTSSSTTTSTPAKHETASVAKATSKTSASTSTARPQSTSVARSTLSSSGSSSSDSAGRTTSGGRLARLTAYWAGEGDYYTGRAISSTGIHLHGGHCAVDPHIIPYGSVVEIAGVGKYLAVDTGSAVISREAAREAAHTSAERNALVIDLYFESRREGEHFAASGPKYASISWWSPRSTDSKAKDAHALFADENWTKIQNKQL